MARSEKDFLAALGLDTAAARCFIPNVIRIAAQLSARRHRQRWVRITPPVIAFLRAESFSADYGAAGNPPTAPSAPYGAIILASETSADLFGRDRRLSMAVTGYRSGQPIARGPATARALLAPPANLRAGSPHPQSTLGASPRSQPGATITATQDPLMPVLAAACQATGSGETTAADQAALTPNHPGSQNAVLPPFQKAAEHPS